MKYGEINKGESKRKRAKMKLGQNLYITRQVTLNALPIFEYQSIFPNLLEFQKQYLRRHRKFRKRGHLNFVISATREYMIKERQCKGNSTLIKETRKDTTKHRLFISDRHVLSSTLTCQESQFLLHKL